MKKYSKGKQKTKSDPNPTGPGFRTGRGFQASNFGNNKIHSQEFNRRPVNIVRHKV